MPVDIARKVLTLNAMVPANWTTTAHQSMRPGSKETSRKGRPPWPPGARSALKVSTHWSPAAVVKKIDPTKKTAPSAAEPTSSTKPGIGPTRKQAEPIANSTPIHHEALRGAHQTPSWRSRPRSEERRVGKEGRCGWGGDASEN